MKGNSVTHHSLKKAYTTKEEAEKVVSYLLSKGVKVYPYKCYCETWHLTSKER
jgi:hypothetical protein